MPLVSIDPDKCNRDGLCVQACPVSLIQMEIGALPEVIAQAGDRCIRCGHCVAVCPKGALTHSLLPMEKFLPVPGNRPSAEAVEALLLSRRSVRGFRKAAVPREQLEQLIEIARRAPTASNSQNVSWVVIEDPARLERVRELTLRWIASDPTRAYHLEAAQKGRDVVLRNGTALAVAYCQESYPWTDVDCAIALTYMELMASSMGLGACWGGLVTKASTVINELPEVLGIPEGHRVGGALMLGQPKQRHYQIPPRNPARVSWL